MHILVPVKKYRALTRIANYTRLTTICTDTCFSPHIRLTCCSYTQSNIRQTLRNTACRAANCIARRRSRFPSHSTGNREVYVLIHRHVALTYGAFVPRATTRRMLPPEKNCELVLPTVPCSHAHHAPQRPCREARIPEFRVGQACLLRRARHLIQWRRVARLVSHPGRNERLQSLGGFLRSCYRPLHGRMGIVLTQSTTST